jgi:hypothetical protein
MLVGFLIELLVAAEPPTPLRLSVNRNKPHAADTTRDDAAPCAGTTDSTGAATDGGSAREGAGSAGDARFTPGPGAADAARRHARRRSTHRTRYDRVAP